MPAESRPSTVRPGATGVESIIEGEQVRAVGAKTRLRALVFDLDGVIVDSERVLLKHWQAIFAAHGCVFTDAEWLASVGSHRGASPYVELCERANVSPPSKEVVERRLRSLVIAELQELGALPGVLEWIDEAESAGIPVAVASSSSQWWVEGRLGDLGLLERIAVRSFRTDSLRPKPEPDVYLDACTKLGVAPGEALAVEDSSNGVRAALRAGLHCVAVPNQVTACLDFSPARLVLSSLATLRLSEVCDRLGLSFGTERVAGRS